ncbi:MAG: hypothetical protein VKK42_01130 [Lyngbya sp.]|nr:hypothetical protein [Lyngbya sp.]
MGVCLFLGFQLYKAKVKIADISAQIEQLETQSKKNIQTIFVGDEELSWETLVRDNSLLLTIKGINKSERQPDKICVLSVVKDNLFYLSGEKRADEKFCQQPSRVIPEEDGTWEFKHTFTDQKSRTIRVEKIYNNTPNSYIDFTIGKNDLS